MKTNRLYILTALLGTVLAGCQKAEELKPEVKPEPLKTATLTVQATMNVDTKALDLDGNSLHAKWALNEKVNVFYEDHFIGTIEVSEVSGAGNIYALLEGDISVDSFSSGNDYDLTLLFPGRDDQDWTYLGQDGSISTLANQFDYAMATLTVTFSNNTVSPTSSATFDPQQSIFRFGFNMPVSSFTISSKKNQLVQSMTYGTAWTSNHGTLTVNPGEYVPAPDGNRYYYFIAISNDFVSNSEDDCFFFSFIDENSSALYEGSKVIPHGALGKGQFAGAKVNLTQKAFAPAPTGTIDTVNDVL